MFPIFVPLGDFFQWPTPWTLHVHFPISMIHIVSQHFGNTFTPPNSHSTTVKTNSTGEWSTDFVSSRMQMSLQNVNCKFISIPFKVDDRLAQMTNELVPRKQQAIENNTLWPEFSKSNLCNYYVQCRIQHDIVVVVNMCLEGFSRMEW